MSNWAKVIIADSRSMEEVGAAAVDLIVTSPPYWHIKDYAIPGQIGFGQTLHCYLNDLYHTWRECFRTLKEGRRLCINIGDQFARAVIYGRYKVIPLHAEFIVQCEDIGFDFMGSIIWQKKTTMNTTGGANVMGSFPYPPNGIVEIDYEFILIFKKAGRRIKVSKEVKNASKMEKDEWKEFFSGHWYFGGAKQKGHEAMFPYELPRRLIKMFTFVGDTVMDPFLGSGTTVKAALDMDRNAIGYEINEGFLEIIQEKIKGGRDLFRNNNIKVVKRSGAISSLPDISYSPLIMDAEPRIDPKEFNFKGDRLYTVTEVINERTIKLDTGLSILLLGVEIEKKERTIAYLKDYIIGKKVFLKFSKNDFGGGDIVPAYVYLKNKIFVNAYLIKAGMAKPDSTVNHELAEKFANLRKDKCENG